jgi:nitroreductase
MSTPSVENAVSSSALIDRLNWRYATKMFDPARKIPPALWTVLEDALVLAPSSFGLQPWKFFVVQNKTVREKLRPAAWNQSQITDASHLVVFAIKKNLNVEDVRRFIALTAKVRGVPVESMAPYQKMMEGFVAKPPMDINAWAARQVYIALGTFLTSAAMLGVDACPMEGFDATAFDNILGLSAQGLTATVLCPLGYRAADDEAAQHAKVRFPKDKIVQTL